MTNLMVTGVAGFIGSNFLDLISAIYTELNVIGVDNLSYSGRTKNLTHTLRKFELLTNSINDVGIIRDNLLSNRVDTVINFAAESHVDNSISGPSIFMETNVGGVFSLLEAVRSAQTLTGKKIRFVQVSTDEVFGDLEPTEPPFSELSPYNPSSPYSATKASGDLLVKAWHRTYGMDTIITHCSNNFGPKQFPEKLIPVVIKSALNGQPIPVYGNGSNIRDWIFVEDHCRGILLAASKGRSGESYCFGGETEIDNLNLVKTICQLLEKLRPRGSGKYEDLIRFVTDRPGHDRRYAIDNSKAMAELGFSVDKSRFTEKLESTIQWYLDNPWGLRS